MAAEAGVNSYVSREEASAYFQHRLDADAWAEAGEEKQDAALVTATRRIDSLRLRGQKADPRQVLAFPRRYSSAFGWYVEQDVPEAVKAATCEEALALLSETAGDRERRKLLELGIVSRAVGDASEAYRQDARPPSDLLSPEARRLLAPYLAGAVSIA